MPGIVGLITSMPREQALPQLKRMLAALCHESTYSHGMWFEESLGVYVGWVARQGSFSDGMPVQNESKDAVLLFSGEEFPEPDTADRLKKQGHELGGASASYLVHLYEEDPSFPAGLNGRFHGMLIDRSRKTAMLFNDRYGMHRIYYHQAKDGFYFSAESKAILAVRPELRTLDPRGLGEFVACGCVLENRTLFEDVHVLPSASTWLFRSASLETKSSYFNPRDWEDQLTLDAESYYAELREVFSRNLPRYFSGHQQVAMSLTGGLDTRMVMAWQKAGPGSLPCYTFGGMLRQCHDVTLARRVAGICRQPHSELSAGQNFLSEFAHYAERSVYLTDGCTDVSRAPDLYLNQRAGEVAPVRMTGNYGGEILRRVRAFKPEPPVSGLFASEVESHIRRASETYAGVLRGHPVSFAVFKQGPWHHYGMLALEQTQLSMRSPFLDNDVVRTVFRAPESTLTTNEVSLRLIADGNPALLRIPTDRGLAGERGRLSQKAARGLLEFSFKAEYAYDMGMPQWVAKVDHTFSSLRLERLFLGRHKIFHFRTWYRNALASYVRDTLFDPRSLSRSYIERKRLEAIVRGHLRGDRNFTTEIHKLLTLEIIHRLFLDKQEWCALKEQPGRVESVGAA